MTAISPRILVVEDERSHQLLIEKSLTGFYKFDVAVSVQQARDLILAHHYDLFLLDILLPDGTGFEVLNDLRRTEKHHLTPVIFLTVKEDLKSKLTGFSLGADDYMIKPPESLELRARIDARLRVAGEMRDFRVHSRPDPAVQFGPITLDTVRLAAVINDSGKQEVLELTPLEFRLLLFFVQNSDRCLSRQQILKDVWGNETHVLERSVDSTVATLRRKLGHHGKMLKSVHRVGYQLRPLAAKKSAA